MKIAPAAAAVAGVAPVLKLVIALTFVIGLSAHSHGQDPAVEIRDQADRIVAQLKTTWSRNKATISALKDRERAERDAQQHFVRQLGAPIVHPCTEQEKSTTERTIVLKLNGIRSAFNTALSSEEERLKTLQREYSMATSSGAAYQTQISLYDKLAWSRARLQMILYLDSILSE